MNRWVFYSEDISVLDPARQVGLLGLILREEDPRPAHEQIEKRYIGGWLDMTEWFKWDGDRSLIVYSTANEHEVEHKEEYAPIASCYLPLSNEAVVLFQYSFLGIFKDGRLMGVTRCD